MTSAASQGRVGMGRPALEIALESKEVFAGELIEGALVVSTEEEVEASSVSVALEGEERTRIKSSRPSPARFILPSVGYADQRREITGVKRILMAERRIEPPGTRIPFSLGVPIDALPSYAGRFSHISWVLKARISFARPPDLLQIAEVKILSKAEDIERQVAITPEKAAVSFTLEVASGTVKPGSHITGWVTMGTVRHKAREVRVEMLAHEVARAKSHGWQDVEVNDRLLAKHRVFRKEEITLGARKAFDLEAPSDLPPTYRGEWSSLDLILRALADMPLRPNVSVSIPLRAGTAPPPRPVN